ncbi:MAG: transglycosylase SLT domain-containing protein [Deltaproteobacteria bacterium]|nr:transglycosylase SLT domain-containing protein [Deltaproteobacteria bacterium]
MKWNPFILLCIGLFSWSNVHGQPLKSAHFPSLVSSLKIATPLEFCGERVPTEIQEIRERVEKELLLSLWDRPQVILWLKRSRRYLPHIEKMLKKSGMPDDLKYVAIAESALRPHVGSKKGAIGFWQFMKYTGQNYGLVINAHIDERRNIFASTEAAIRCFKDLHETFGSWTLAAAAYNMGEDGLVAEILEQGTNNYYHLYLPLETKRYVFRILSIKLIFSDPERYGFQLSEEDYYPPIKFDRIQVDCFQDTPIRIIAQAAKTYFKVIKDLNPEFRGHYLLEGSHAILIPKGASKGFQARYRHLLKHWLMDQKERIYVVKKGDSLSSIADQFDVPLAAIIIWNRLNPNTPIHPGDQLIIHQKELKPVEIDKDEDDSKANSSRND